LIFGPVPETPLTEPDFTKMRLTVYQKLCLAQNDLPSGFRFRIYEAFRSITVQQMLFDEEHQKVMAQSPHKTAAEIFHDTTRLVSPVINLDGSRNVPPHNTGAAVDLEIIDQNGQVIDMGMEAKDCFWVDPDLCMTDCSSVNDIVRKNRKLLFDVMTAHGFVNYPTEWWHFSYGDRYWAYHKNQAYAIYGPADELAN
nr:M15 family metallopeptidase [Pseudomonadota bacterium]